MVPERPPQVGLKIQKERKKQHLTLSLLAEKSGVSKAMLSQIEANKVNPTVATVWKIAQGLGVEVNILIGASKEEGKKFILTRKESLTQLRAEDEKTQIRVLSPLSMADELEVYLLDFQPDAILNSKPHFPGSEELVTVLKGGVRIRAGKNEAELHEGDFIIYHCDVDHSIVNISNEDAHLHMIVRFRKMKR